jgi:uncharacterized protein (UPF0297 family)
MGKSTMEPNIYDIALKYAPLIISLLTAAGLIPAILAMRSIIKKYNLEPEVMVSTLVENYIKTAKGANEITQIVIAREKEYINRENALRDELRLLKADQELGKTENGRLREEIRVMSLKITALEATLRNQAETIKTLRIELTTIS